MANRHLSRSVVLQSLFEWDFEGANIKKNFSEILKRNIEEFAPGIEDTKFIKDTAEGILKHQNKIDEVIEKAAPDWPIPQIAIVDRNILRIGLYEILFGDKKQVPSKVAINESIELAKTFGGSSSGRFINGVLGTVYKELGEPNKDVPSKRKNKEEVDPEKLPKELLAGAVVYRSEGDKIYLAFVHDVFGRWTLSKGKVREGEAVRNTALREIKEEIDINGVIEAEIGENAYTASDPERGKIRKVVTYFLMSTKETEIHLKETGGLTDAKWFLLENVSELEMYDDIIPVITRAVTLLREKIV